MHGIFLQALFPEDVQYLLRNKDVVYIHTHYLRVFELNILPHLQKRIILITHNSDDAFDNERILNSPMIEHIYAQNLNVVHKKATLLPIGLANSRWPHGQLDVFYRVMENLPLKKTKEVYVNLNEGTYPLRKMIIEKLGFKNTTETLSFEQYLTELAQHEFALCVRGNGIDTHRFWECLYLRVVPIIVNTPETCMSPFVENLKRLGHPFVEVTCLDEPIKLPAYASVKFKPVTLAQVFSRV